MAKTQTKTSDTFENSGIIVKLVQLPGLVVVTQMYPLGIIPKDKKDEYLSIISKQNQKQNSGIFALERYPAGTGYAVSYTQQVVCSIMRNKAANVAEFVLENGKARLKGLLFDMEHNNSEV